MKRRLSVRFWCVGVIVSLLSIPSLAATADELIRRHAQLLGDRMPSYFQRNQIKSELLGRDVDYAVLLPDGYEESREPYPLVLFLHGANGDREYLALRQHALESMWRNEEIPRFVVATVSAGLSFYMDDLSGVASWESFILDEWLPHLRANLNVDTRRERTILTGISMGGFGSLMLAFRNPDAFGAVAAMEPMVWPALTFAKLEPYQRIMPAALLAEVFGAPLDEARWRDHNPASIVAANPERIRNAGMAIYIECGDEDGFGFHEGTEFLHRTLWDHRIRHEYRLVLGADHVGKSLADRSRNRFRFIGNYLTAPSAEPALERFRTNRARAARESGYEPNPFWPNEARPLISGE